MSFAKIWTNCYSDEWFLSLSLTERSVFLQLIVLAKMQQDCGKIAAKMLGLGSLFGGDSRTVSKILAKMCEDGKIEYTVDPNKVVTITLKNYVQWQELRGEDQRDKHGRTGEKILQNCSKNVLEQTRAEQSRLGDSRFRASQGELRHRPSPEIGKLPEYHQEPDPPLTNEQIETARLAKEELRKKGLLK